MKVQVERQTLEARLHRHANAQYRARRRELDDIDSLEDEADIDNASQALLDAIWLSNHRYYK